MVTPSVSMVEVARKVMSGLGAGTTHVVDASLLASVVDAIRFDAIVFDLSLGEHELERCRRIQPHTFLVVASDKLIDPGEYGAQYVMLKPLSAIVLERAMIDAGVHSRRVAEQPEG